MTPPRALVPLLAAVCLLAPGAGAAGPAKPNVVVIMADDLGYGDVSCNGATAVTTPNIDRIASGGRRFTSGYSSASTGTPTRFSLLTGPYAFRQKGTGIAAPNAAAIIRPGTETLPGLLKRAGYATAVVGKWHLGLGDKGPDWNGELKPGPLDVGFDHCFVLPTTNDRVPQVIVEDRRVRGLDPKDPLWVGDKQPPGDHPTGLTHRATLKMDWSHGHNNSVHNGVGRIGFTTGGVAARFRDEDLADGWVRESTRWIEANKARPFFLFFASHDLHVPRLPHERFRGKSGLGPRGDAILELDWSVGEVLDTLDRLKLADDTLVVFCSDNGPVLDDGYKDDAVRLLGKHTPAGPFRGAKGTTFEAGTRTPLLTRWPARIKPGVSDAVVCTIDLASSLAALVGTPVPAGACLDSFDVLPALLGEPGAAGRDHLVQQANAGLAGNLGLRVGDWKLLRTGAKKPAGPALYDLAADPGETTDVAAKHPGVIKRLGAQLDGLIAAGRSRPAK